MEALSILLVFLFLIYLAFGLDDENDLWRRQQESDAARGYKTTIDATDHKNEPDNS